MTQRQRENLAKYLYDLSKIVLAAAVIGNLIAWNRFNVVTFSLGGMTEVGLFYWGYYLDGLGR